jgi:deoxyribonuclease-1
MQSDMHNLFPAIGAVNAMKSNYSFVAQVDKKSGFGNCDMKIESRKAQPPISSRGRIARTYLYMDFIYQRYSMSKSQTQVNESMGQDVSCKRVGMQQSYEN